VQQSGVLNLHCRAYAGTNDIPDSDSNTYTNEIPYELADKISVHVSYQGSYVESYELADEISVRVADQDSDVEPYELADKATDAVADARRWLHCISSIAVRSDKRSLLRRGFLHVPSWIHVQRRWCLGMQRLHSGSYESSH
jgi:hypothetical protein